ncbi:MAG: UDP-2,3-diacylglucosamine diphosphatase [Planctomycetota bacterium]|jgi:UDP-2,3-diacylglucosamine pyrophosphatase LpxH
MITNIAEDRLLVVSDVHIGSLFFKAAESFQRFLRHVADHGFNLCINGDGVDILQTSLLKMTYDLFAEIDDFGRILREGRRVYYVIGNHDILLEHFLEDFRSIRLAPFLNVTSGDTRVRIEHGHLYDPHFVKNPDLYFFLTKLSGYFLRIHPGLYHLSTAAERTTAVLRQLGWGREEEAVERIKGEHPSFREAVDELAQRGFDAVIFGHTHLPGEVNLGQGKTYYNTGCWFRDPRYVKIENGAVEMLRWRD